MNVIVSYELVMTFVIVYIEVTVRFQDATDTVSEDDGSVTITIIKEGNADIPVMVGVTTSDGSATGN